MLQGRSVEAGKGLEVQKQKWGQIGSRGTEFPWLLNNAKPQQEATKNKAICITIMNGPMEWRAVVNRQDPFPPEPFVAP